MNERDEALDIAQQLEDKWWRLPQVNLENRAAAYLRLQHADNARLTEERDALQALLRDREYIRGLASLFSMEKTIDALGKLDPASRIAFAPIKETT